MAALNGHVAIVTGGGRGLGRAVAERLASMGAAVVVASRNLWLRVALRQICCGHDGEPGC